MAGSRAGERSGVRSDLVDSRGLLVGAALPRPSTALPRGDDAPTVGAGALVTRSCTAGRACDRTGPLPASDALATTTPAAAAALSAADPPTSDLSDGTSDPTWRLRASDRRARKSRVSRRGQAQLLRDLAIGEPFPLAQEQRAPLAWSHAPQGVVEPEELVGTALHSRGRFLDHRRVSTTSRRRLAERWRSRQTFSAILSRRSRRRGARRGPGPHRRPAPAVLGRRARTGGV